jgi:hypothetical protein
VRRGFATTLATLALLAVAAFGSGCKAHKRNADEVKLSSTYTTASKLAVVHYPADFGPSQAGDKVAVLTPLTSSSYDDAIEIHFGTNDKPVTSVLEEYVKILHKPFQDTHPDWKEETHQQGNCFKGFPGVEIVATFTGSKGKKLRYRSCTFFASGHGFWLAYMAPVSSFAEDEPVLRKIVDATEIRP